MRAIANRYKRGELVGLGFEADFGGARCHIIAWADGQVERLRDDPRFTESLVIDQCDANPMGIVGIPDSIIATHEQIEPAVSETPIPPIQEPVVVASELTASPPALAPDTAEVVPEWKPTPGHSEAKTIRSYFQHYGIAATHKQVITDLSALGVAVTSSQVLVARKAMVE